MSNPINGGQDKLTDAQVRKLAERNLLDLMMVEKELKKREIRGNPLWYGLPDLLFPQGMMPGYLTEDGEVVREPLPYEESDAQYEERQNAALKKFVEEKMFLVKDTKKVYIRLLPPMLKFLGDLFFRRQSRAILWKPRGGGGSLGAGVLIWLCMVFRQMSFIDQAGSGEQAKVVYNYTKQFWDCIPKVKKYLLAKDPMLTETRLTTGVELKCISSSEKQARGKHLPGFVGDESCAEDEATGKAMLAAMQGAMSEPDNMLVLLSTFHVPVGFFQEHWDFAREKGFARYKWNCFDTMEKCDRGMEYATTDDPKAIESYCKSGKCPLSWQDRKRDNMGRKTDELEWKGCLGAARDAEGFRTFEQVEEMKTVNAGTNVFEIEHVCERPSWMSAVYDPDLVDASVVDAIELPHTAPKVVGIDWGHATVGSMTMVMAAKGEDAVYVPEAIMTDHQLIGDLIEVLESWREKYGAFVIFADRSHPFENAELQRVGFPVYPVDFGSQKRLGIQNIQHYLGASRIKILSDFEEGLKQLKNYRHDSVGKIVKKADHFCDALLCAMLYFPFAEYWDSGSSTRVSVQDAGKQIYGNDVDSTSDGSVVLI
jgi:hypothetical protein